MKNRTPLGLASRSHHLRKLIVLAALAGCATLSANASRLAEAADGPKYDLKYKFSANQFGHFQVVHNTRMKSQYNEAVSITENETTTWRHYRVTAVGEDGSGSLELMIDRVILSAKANDDKQPIVFDTNKPEPTLLKEFAAVTKCVGRPLARMTISPTGRMLDVTALQSLHGSGGNDVADADQNDGSLNIMILLPEQKVAVGQTWDDDFTVDVNVTAKLRKQVPVRRVYRLVAVDGDKATIEYKTSLLAPVNDPALKAQLIMRTPSGKVMFDIKEGRILSREMTVDELVLGPFGAKSSMHAVCNRHERRLKASEISQGLKQDTRRK